MRFVIAILLTALLAGITTWLLPWWMIAVSAFIVMLIISVKPAGGFFAGFLGIALLWLIVVMMKDMSNAHILSGRMVKLFGLPNAALFIAVTVFLGGLVGGLSGWSGALTRKIFKQ
jgi:hypothetical protein